MSLTILTGASGSGKTAIAEAVAARFAGTIDVHYFDRIGVPPVERMIAEHGSPEEWQRAMTMAWMTKLSAAVKAGRKVVLEGQMRLSFVMEAASTAGISCFPILVDCDDDTRTRRLTIDRRQPELANADMMNWAAYLRREAIENGCEILDTSGRTLDESVAHLVARLAQQHRLVPRHA
jgi:predicted kinase